MKIILRPAASGWTASILIGQGAPKRCTRPTQEEAIGALLLAYRHRLPREGINLRFAVLGAVDRAASKLTH